MTHTFTESLEEVVHERPDFEQRVVARLTFGDVFCAIIQVEKPKEKRFEDMLFAYGQDMTQ